MARAGDASEAAPGGATREVMDVRQAAEYLGISADTLYRYASEGSVPAFRLGNRWRFKKSRLDTWMDAQSNQPVSNAAAPSLVKPKQRKPVRAVREA
jgi:excisionase family DNA binding protein